MNTQPISFIADKLAKLDWKNQIEGRFFQQGALDKFLQPDSNGWRLPTLDELKTLIGNRKVVSEFLPHTYDTSAMWSSTRYDESQAIGRSTIISGTSHVWAVSLDGDIYYYYSGAFIAVRLVRDTLA